MQTFLPHPNFAASAMVLDSRRLGNQRNECTVLIRACVHGPSQGWYHHPVTRMWRPWLDALRLYKDVIVREWCRRGYSNEVGLYFSDHWTDPLVPEGTQIEMPPWLGREELHSSHRGMLMRKMPEWYDQFNWVDPVPEDHQYWWPQQHMDLIDV